MIRASLHHSGNIFLTALKAYDRCLEEAKDPEKFKQSEQPIIALFFSQIYLEAFINEIIFKSYCNGSKSNVDFINLDYLISIKPTLGRISLAQKYQYVKKTLTNEFYEKGRNPFQDFELLIKLRNHIIHLQPSETDDDCMEWSEPEFVDFLASKGLMPRRDIEAGPDLYQRMRTTELARWACITALNMAQSIADCFPPGSDKDTLNKRVETFFKRIDEINESNK